MFGLISLPWAAIYENTLINRFQKRMHVLSIADNRADWHSDKVLDSYSVGTLFESRPEHWLS
jgi:hypothetical protein